LAHLNETARFIQNDVVSYKKKKKKEEGQNGVVLNDTVHLPPSPVEQQQKTKTIFKKTVPPLSPRPHTFRPPNGSLADQPLRD
jgi:hypothetical protein